MKITVNQLRRIIKEEVSRVLKEAPMEVDSKIEVLDVSVKAEGMEMSPEEWSGMVKMIAKKYPDVDVEYSSEYDSLIIYGPRVTLEELGLDLDEKLAGSAQSIGVGESFVDLIEEID